jgi:Mrp family chromosome partitioning ATPase
MKLFTNDPEKLILLGARFGFEFTSDPSQADGAVIFCRTAPEAEKIKAGLPPNDFACVVSEGGEFSMSDVIRLAFLGIAVAKTAASAVAVARWRCQEDFSPQGQSVSELPAGSKKAVRVGTPEIEERISFLQIEGQENEMLSGETEEAAGSGSLENGQIERRERQEGKLFSEKCEGFPAAVQQNEPERQEDEYSGAGGGPLPNLIASYSPSTSVGKTFVAVNAAAWLAAKGARVALVDLDPDKADLWHTTYMDAFGPPQVTVSNWFDVAGDPLEHVARHPELPNLSVVPGTTVVGGRLPDAGEVAEILQALAANFDIVVADLNAMIRLSHIAVALKLAGKVFLLSDLSEKCVAQTSMIFAQASNIVGRNKMSLVVNKAKRGQIYRPKDVAKMFGFPEFSEIPEDTKLVNWCLKKRKFPVFTKSQVGEALNRCFEKELGGFVFEPVASRSKAKLAAKLLSLFGRGR